MSNEEDLRRTRGAQLRALVVSWDEGRQYDEVLAEQQEQINTGKLTPSEEWSVAADEILGYYMSRPRKSAVDQLQHDHAQQAQSIAQVEAPRIIIP